MMENENLDRFRNAQSDGFDIAVRELERGRKRSHWMWYIFPQIIGLGHSEMSRQYAITGLQEARAYLDDPLLGKRLKTLCGILMDLPETDAQIIFGSPDDLKLKSCMTLFSSVPDADPIFKAVLHRFFGGARDPLTVQILSGL